MEPSLKDLFEAGVVVIDGKIGQVRVVTALQSKRNMGV
jgi:hypothetical protein